MDPSLLFSCACASPQLAAARRSSPQLATARLSIARFAARVYVRGVVSRDADRAALEVLVRGRACWLVCCWVGGPKNAYFGFAASSQLYLSFISALSQSRPALSRLYLSMEIRLSLPPHVALTHGYLTAI